MSAIASKSPYDAFFGKTDYSDYSPHFQDHQRLSAKALIDHIFPTAKRAPHQITIKKIIDVGCGDGSILKWIQEGLTARKSEAAEFLEFVGLDISSKGINKADSLKIPKAKFETVSDESDLRSRLAYHLTGCEETTAVFFLGHTWFHFLEQEELLEFIRRSKPAMLVIDFHEHWDKAIDELSDKPFVDDLLVRENGIVKALRTKLHCEGTVLRGLVEIPSDEGEEIWTIQTKQIKQKSEHLLGTKEEYDKISSAIKAGKLVGGCNYFVSTDFHHESGWGRMKANILIALDDNARVMNQEWAIVLRDLVRTLFIKKISGGNEAIQNIRHLLEFFNEARTLSGEQFNHREAAIIMPFDKMATFARMTGLFKDSDDTHIFSHDLLLELPNRAQRRFPSAYGLYHTLLDIVSSPVAFALDWAPNYERSSIDKEYETLEAQLLRFTGHANPELFIVPIYLGALPLFCLVLKFPNAFPKHSSSAEIYRAILTNLHNQIKVLFDDQFIRNQIISPFIADALEVLHKKQCESKGLKISCSRQDRIEKYLTCLWDHISGVCKKEWKSWILTIPSQPISELESTKAEYKRLERIWAEEKERALKDDELRISYWFQEADFFGKESHNKWDAVIHKKKLERMLEIAGVAKEDGWDGLKGDCVEQNGYLKASSDSYLLRWAIKMLESLSYIEDNKCDDIYQDLKSVFCKMRANYGQAVRFSWKRLANIINAAISSKDTKLEFVKVPSLTECWTQLDGRFCCNKIDPSIPIGDITKWFVDAELLQSAGFDNTKFQFSDEAKTYRGVIQFTLKANEHFIGLAKDAGGCDLKQLEDAFERLKVNEGEFNCNAFGKSKLNLNITIDLSREDAGQSLGITTTFSSS